MNKRAVKVSRGEVVDGKARTTAKQTTQEKVVQNKTFQGHSFSIHDSMQAPREQDNASTCDGWHFVNDAIISSDMQLNAS